MKYALQIAYDGSDFTGFQASDGKRSVQSSLQSALETVLAQKIICSCAGRTDSGVHAYGQVISFQAQIPIALERLLVILNQRLPQSIAARAIWPLADDFDARFSARARHYRYSLRTQPNRDPFANRYAWEYPYRLDLDLLQTAWQRLQGHHDFALFAKSGSSHQSSQLEVWLTHFVEQEQFIQLDIVAERFLYAMVRQLVGTCLEIARGHLPLGHLDLLFEQKTSYKGLIAPAQGLFLCRAIYPAAFGLQIEYPNALPAECEALIQERSRIDPGKWWNDPS